MASATHACELKGLQATLWEEPCGLISDVPRVEGLVRPSVAFAPSGGEDGQRIRSECFAATHHRVFWHGLRGPHVISRREAIPSDIDVVFQQCQRRPI